MGVEELRYEDKNMKSQAHEMFKHLVILQIPRPSID